MRKDDKGMAVVVKTDSLFDRQNTKRGWGGAGTDLGAMVGPGFQMPPESQTAIEQVEVLCLASVKRKEEKCDDTQHACAPATATPQVCYKPTHTALNPGPRGRQHALSSSPPVSA